MSAAGGLGLFLALAAAAPAPARQEPTAAPQRPRVRVGIAPQPPVLDGLPGEEEWSAAARITDFREVEPVEGRPASAPTEVWLMRDQERLYIGLVSREPEPSRMVLQNMRRDALLEDDDRIEIVLDTFRDGRTAYFFQLSAAGSRGDALIGDNGRRFNKRWDTYWEGVARVGPDRWTAEIAIPFRAIAFGRDGVWRANFQRYRGADRSEARWAAPRRDVELFIVSEAGEIEGMDGLEQGLGVEFVPYLKAKDRETEAPEDRDLLGSGGGEVIWRATPQLTASVTVRTDFAETEADERRVNLTRFPLFFPEKRDFFLEDSNLFAFGEQVSFGGGGGGADLLPFFSRRIGLAPAGMEIPIQGGARLAGRAGPLDLGLLAVRTDPLPSEGVPAADLFVARPSLDVRDDLAVGALITAGNPYASAQNLVGGLDVRYSSVDVLPGTFSSNAWWVRSDDEATSEVGDAYGAQLSLETKNWVYGLSALAAQKSFQPALGFVRRPGERRFGGEVLWEPRPDAASPVRNYAFGVEPEIWTDSAGELQSYTTDLTLFGVDWDSGDALELQVELQGDRPEQAFSPVSGTTIAAGDYDWAVLGGEFEFSRARPLSGRLRVEGGSYYDGNAGRLRAGAAWRPSAAFRLALTYREDRAWLPGGDFTTRVEILNVDFSFSPDLTLENLVQADNESDRLGLQSRLRWIQRDGRELFVVVNAGWQELPGERLVPAGRDITLKALYALRF